MCLSGLGSGQGGQGEGEGEGEGEGWGWGSDASCLPPVSSVRRSTSAPCLGSGVRGSGVRVLTLDTGAQGSGVRVQGFRGQGSGVRGQDGACLG